MRTILIRWWMVLVALLVWSGSRDWVRPADPPQRPEHVVKISVDLIQMDVTVTDSKGRPVPGLTAADFRVFENGEERPVTYLRYVPAAGGPGRGTAGRAAGQSGAGQPGNPVESTYIVIVVDDLGLRFTNLASARKALLRFVNSQMREGDRVALVCTGKNLGAFQPFTSDKALLLAAIQRLHWNPLGRMGISAAVPAEELIVRPMVKQEIPCRDLEGRQAISEYAYYREQVAVAGTFNALEGIMRSLAAMPGRKAVVVFSDGIPLQPEGSRFLDYLERFHRVIDQANNAAVRIYPVFAGGLESGGLKAENNELDSRIGIFSGSDIDARAAALRSLDRGPADFLSGSRSSGMFALAQASGGQLYFGSNDLNRALKRVLLDQSGYYLIGYTPSEKAFQRSGNRLRFNQVKLDLVRPGLKLNYRRGYFGLDDASRHPEVTSRLEVLTQALIRPLNLDPFDLVLELEAGTGPAELQARIHVDPDRLRFSRTDSGDYQAEIDMLAITVDKQGNLVDQSDRVFTVQASPEEFEAAKRHDLTLPYRPALPGAGGYQVRVAVRDAGSGLTGMTLRYIDVK
jgi:VWFA-related protein